MGACSSRKFRDEPPSKAGCCGCWDAKLEINHVQVACCLSIKAASYSVVNNSKQHCNAERNMSYTAMCCCFQGKIKGGGTGKVAIEHYTRFPADYQLMQQMGVNVHRSAGWLSAVWLNTVDEHHASVMYALQLYIPLSFFCSLREPHAVTATAIMTVALRLQVLVLLAAYRGRRPRQCCQ